MGATNITIQEIGTSIYQGPEGTMMNGKIVPSVVSNNLTVALKTKAGNDPSAVDPVYVVIGGVTRKITAALSVTKNAGTNWCNAGSAELATKEIDYFVYLGYNATDGVVIGFSRIPYAGIYSDFSTTTTNEKYCAISTITNAAAGDNYEVIGRFAATLGATANFYWSVPTYTNINLIQRPIYETRKLLITPVVTGFSSNPTGGEYAYMVSGRKCQLKYSIDIIGNSNATTLTLLAPFGASSSSYLGAFRTFDNGAYKAIPGVAEIGTTTTINLYLDWAQNAWTNSGNKGAQGLNLHYFI